MAIPAAGGIQGKFKLPDQQGVTPVVQGVKGSTGNDVGTDKNASALKDPGNVKLDAAHQNTLNQATNQINGAANGPVQNLNEAMRNDVTQQVYNDQQSTNAGVQRTSQEHGAGGVAGFFGAKEGGSQYTAEHVDDTTTAGNKNRLDALADSVGNRPIQQMTAQNATAAQLNAGQSDQTRARQNALLDSLQGTISGKAPSAANATLQSATDKNLAASLAQAAAGGGSPAAMRAAAFSRAGIQQDAAAQSAALRANEIATAQGQLGSAAAQTRDQDIGTATANAGMTQQTNLANQAAQNEAGQTNLLSTVEQQQQKDAMLDQLMTQGFTLDEAQRQTEIMQRQNNAGLLVQQEAARMGVNAQNSASAAQAGGAIIGAIASSGASLAASGAKAAASTKASDQRVKTKIEDGDKGIEAFLDSLAAKDYDYKDPAKHGEGRHAGIMAQDLEKSDTGKRLVTPSSDGVKMVDINKSVMASLASLANINKRLREIEK